MEAGMLKRLSHTSFLFFLVSLAVLFGLRPTTQAQLRIAPVQPEQIGDVIACYTGGKREELKPDKSLIQASSFAFAPNNIETQKLFDDVARHTELRINVYTVPVTDRNVNVQICPSDGGRNYIAFHPAWLQRVYDETQNKWALYAIIAHEVGHYALNHDRVSVGSAPPLELAADEYAGETLAKMGASLGDAQAAYRSSVMASPASHTHPPIAQRLAAVARGWGKVGAASTGTGVPGITPTQPARPRYNQAIGVPCKTTDGRRYRC